MTLWATRIDVHVDGLTDEKLEDLVEQITPRSGALSYIDGALSVTIDVDAAGPGQAVDAAARDVERMLRDLGASGVVVAGEAMTEDEQDRRLAEPALPELLGAAEVAEVLRVSKQRLAELRPRLPEPVVTLASGPVWLRASIEAFDRSWERRPGRPRREPDLVVHGSDGSVTVVEVKSRGVTTSSQAAPVLSNSASSGRTVRNSASGRFTTQKTGSKSKSK